LAGLLARGVVRAATMEGHRTTGPSPAYALPAPKIYGTDTLTVQQLAECLKKANELDREAVAIESKRPALKQEESSLHRFETALEARRIYLNRKSQKEVDEFNESIDRYNRQGEVLKLEQQAFNTGVDAHNVKATLYDASCARRYYADDMEQAKTLAGVE
jgi:hypothetical protein